MIWSAQGTMLVAVALVLPRTEVRHPLALLVRALVPSGRPFVRRRMT